MSSCSSAPAQPAPSKSLPVIKVNGVEIEEIDLASELQYHQNANFDVVVQQAAQALVVRQLLLNEAKSKGFTVSKEHEEEVLQKLLAENVTSAAPSTEACLRYFKNNPDKFMTLPLLEVDHILLAAAKDDIAGRDEAKKNALNIIEQLEKDPTLFAALATQYSACPSKATGGSLGQISKGQTVPEFERVLMLMPEGLGDKPLESRYGLHVVNITRKIEGEPLEYSMVEDKVKGYLVHRASHLAIQAFIQDLVEKADIEGVKMLFAEQNIYI
ncbi:MAG: peptidyl-prolyl cis-trans isomerase C [Psychromonas sp.]|jgi:peptidyl-prolyl cis-trans isomerase C|uniref:peptidylprolyl isomerase n=1 Tax=Psychromonas sp. TaxID=1884585 RepID=UPI0039E321A6